jgi:hypothetical protein
MELFKRPVAPYVVPLDQAELRGYHGLRIPAEPAAPVAQARPAAEHVARSSNVGWQESEGAGT